MINVMFSMLLIVNGATTTTTIIDGFQGQSACEWAKNVITQAGSNTTISATCFTRQNPMHMGNKKHG